MSKVEWSKADFTYDGKEKKVELIWYRMSLRKLLFLHLAKQMQCVNMHMYLALPMVLIRFR